MSLDLWQSLPGMQRCVLQDLQHKRPVCIDGKQPISYLSRLHVPINMVIGLGYVDTSMQDARNAGVCLTLKVYVQTLQRALSYLINDLSNHAWECRRERIHSFTAVKRHRKAIDEAVQRFLRMTGQIPVADDLESSVRMQAQKQIAEFYKRLPSLLPALDYPNSSSIIDGNAVGAKDWGERLRVSAETMDTLSNALSPLKTELDGILDEKSRICKEIERSMQKMVSTL